MRDETRMTEILYPGGEARSFCRIKQYLRDQTTLKVFLENIHRLIKEGAISSLLFLFFHCE